VSVANFRYNLMWRQSSTCMDKLQSLKKKEDIIVALDGVLNKVVFPSEFLQQRLSERQRRITPKHIFLASPYRQRFRQCSLRQCTASTTNIEHEEQLLTYHENMQSVLTTHYSITISRRTWIPETNDKYSFSELKNNCCTNAQHPLFIQQPISSDVLNIWEKPELEI